MVWPLVCNASSVRAASKDTVSTIGTTSSTTIEEDGDIIRIPSVYDFQLDEYQGLNISIPHFTSLLEVLSKENIDIIQCSTPGPVGLAGLLAAKVMNLTVIGQYHTDFKAYALAHWEIQQSLL